MEIADRFFSPFVWMLGRSCGVEEVGRKGRDFRQLLSWRRAQIHINIGNNGRPYVSKLVLARTIWGTGHMESDSVDAISVVSSSCDL